MKQMRSMIVNTVVIMMEKICDCQMLLETSRHCESSKKLHGLEYSAMVTFECYLLAESMLQMDICTNPS